ncbi:hypothetical protein Tco_0768181, partial [Tanacetum coccineum]
MNSGGLYHMTYLRDYLVNFGEYDGDTILLGDGRECRVRGTGKVVTRKTLEGRKQLGEYQTGWKIKTGNERDTLGSGLSKVLWAEDTTMSIYLVNKVIKLWRLDDVTSNVVLYRNMSFNVSGEYKKTFISSGVAGSHKVQTRDLIYYHLTRDKEQHSAHELLKYREDSNEAAFAVAEAEKIYAHESLTFNDTVACE